MFGRKNCVGKHPQRNSDKSRQGRPTDNISRERWKEAKLRQDRQSTYKRNIYARSRNHCCCEKVTSITHSVCVCVYPSYPACKAHAPYYIFICGLSVSTILFNLIPQTARFSRGGGGGVNEHKLCILIFSTTFVWNISHSKNEWMRQIVNVYWSLCKISVFLKRF
jgi:hypothetical protein